MSQNLNFDNVIRFAPTATGILFFVIFLLFKLYKGRGRDCDLYSLMVVGFTGSSVPTGCLLVYAAFDSTAMEKLSDAPTYIAFAGLAILYIAVMSIKEKL
ncbi:MAG: hypothetical protein PHQ03_05650 [Methylococcales bacterium]|nr:hypothetical protein [Methylococcales bacterium]